MTDPTTPSGKPNPYALRRSARRFEGHSLVRHRMAHSDPSHHIGPCSPPCRAGRIPHYHRDGRHLYSGAGASRAKADFERRYGKRKGDYVYGATIGKVRRLQLARRRAMRRPASPQHRRR